MTSLSDQCVKYCSVSHLHTLTSGWYGGDWRGLKAAGSMSQSQLPQQLIIIWANHLEEGSPPIFFFIFLSELTPLLTLVSSVFCWLWILIFCSPPHLTADLSSITFLCRKLHHCCFLLYYCNYSPLSLLKCPHSFTDSLISYLLVSSN